ncbi:MAG: hypothetical protein U9N61_02690 [Euryarchaeota archaeon]|nr:hypothetical protein [Euryarchaeota archaeon]
MVEAQERGEVKGHAHHPKRDKRKDKGMKKVLLVLLLTALPLQASFAVDWLYGGVRYTDQVHISGGAAENITGGLWSFNTMNAGSQSGWDSDMAYLLEYGDFFGGIMAGTGVVWQGDEHPVTYIPTMAGAMGGYYFTESLGLWGYTKYKDGFDTDNHFLYGWDYGIGLCWKL